MKKYYLILVLVCAAFWGLGDGAERSPKDKIDEDIKLLRKCFVYVKKSSKDTRGNFIASDGCVWATKEIDRLKSMNLSKSKRGILEVLDKDFKKYIKKRWGKYPPVIIKGNLSFIVLDKNWLSHSQEFKALSVSADSDRWNFIPGGTLKWFKPVNINNKNIDDFIYEINKACKVRKDLPLMLPDDISQEMFTKLMKGINVCYLDLGYTRFIKDVSALENSTNLKELHLLVNADMKGFEVLGKLHEFEILELESNRHTLNDLTFLCKIPSLKILKISDSNIKSLVGLKNFPNLEELTIIGPEIEKDLSPVANVKKLKKFKLIVTVYPHEAKDITPLGNLSELKELALRIDINDITPLAKLQNLEKLYLSVAEGTDLSPIGKLKKLRALSPPYWIKDLKFLEKSDNLENLHLSDSQVNDISGITKLKKLKKLNLWYCEKLKNYSPIGELPNLQILYLTAVNVKSLDFLAKLKNLQSLHMLKNDTIKDFTPLTKLPHLKELVIDAFEYLDDSKKEMLVKALPKCSIEFGGLCFCIEGKRYLSFE